MRPSGLRPQQQQRGSCANFTGRTPRASAAALPRDPGPAGFVAVNTERDHDTDHLHSLAQHWRQQGLCHPQRRHLHDLGLQSDQGEQPDELSAAHGLQFRDHQFSERGRGHRDARPHHAGALNVPAGCSHSAVLHYPQRGHVREVECHGNHNHVHRRRQRDRLGLHRAQQCRAYGRRGHVHWLCKQWHGRRTRRFLNRP